MAKRKLPEDEEFESQMTHATYEDEFIHLVGEA